MPERRRKASRARGQALEIPDGHLGVAVAEQAGGPRPTPAQLTVTCCSDTPWSSCGQRPAGSGRSGPHTSAIHATLGAHRGTAPSRCGEGVGVRAGQHALPGQTWLAQVLASQSPPQPPTLFLH